jgi:polysaccharide biosynthesis protein VpsQ
MKKITILFAAFLVVIIVLADSGRLGFLGFIYDFPYGDKVGHFFLYGILSLLLNLTFLRSRPPSTSKRVAVTVTLLLALAIGLEEWSQNFFAGRTPSWADLLFGYVGVSLGAWVAWKVRHIFGKSESV